jgi:hypothetical protein
MPQALPRRLCTGQANKNCHKRDQPGAGYPYLNRQLGGESIKNLDAWVRLSYCEGKCQEAGKNESEALIYRVLQGSGP